MPLAWRCCARQSSGPRPGHATGTLWRGRAGWPVSLPSAAPVPPPAEAQEGVCRRPHPRRRCARGVWHATGWGASRCGPCMLSAICAGPWWWTKLSLPSASSAAATTYSCSAVRHAVGACVAGGWQGSVSRQGTWGSSCTGHAATGPMVTAATADASAVRSAGFVLPEPRGIFFCSMAPSYPGGASRVT